MCKAHLCKVVEEEPGERATNAILECCKIHKLARGAKTLGEHEKFNGEVRDVDELLEKWPSKG